jgi:hypothetical protein
MSKIQIIMEYQVTDGYTYWSTCTIPILYDGTVEALVSFEEALKEAERLTNAAIASKAHDWTQYSSFEFAGRSFDISEFYERTDDGKDYLSLPNFYTVDEWFK